MRMLLLEFESLVFGDDVIRRGGHCGEVDAFAVVNSLEWFNAGHGRCISLQTVKLGRWRWKMLTR
jgi:hypothetical protein